MNKIYWMYLIRIELNLVSEEKIRNKANMLAVFILKKGGVEDKEEHNK